jgi:hypothetical protein
MTGSVEPTNRSSRFTPSAPAADNAGSAWRLAPGRDCPACLSRDVAPRNMTRMFKRAVAANLISSVVVVFAWTLYALAQGQPIAEQWMGLRWEFGFPIWMDILAVEAVVLWVFCVRRKTEEWKVRLLVGGIGTWGLVFTLGLPLLLPGLAYLFPAPDWTADRVVWWYACISDLAYGLVGTATLEDRQQREADRSAGFSKRVSCASDAPKQT